MGSVAVAMCSSEVNQAFQRVQFIALTVLIQEEQKLVAMLEREMVQQNPGVSWNDIAGVTTSKSLPLDALTIKNRSVEQSPDGKIL